MARTILVTGGLGFIGSHFIRLLLGDSANRRVVNLDKLTYAGNPDNLQDVDADPRYRLAVGDIADRSIVEGILESERPDVIVNFAAESHVDRSILDPTPFLAANVDGVVALLEGVRRHGVHRFIQISTDEVYGDIPLNGPRAREESAVRPSSPYSASKAAAELLCFAYARTYQTPVVIARSSNNYGPNQFPEKLLPLMIRNSLIGHRLPVYGDGKQIRDWIHVEDNARGIQRVMEDGQPGTAYNIATGAELENIEVVRELCAAVSSETGRSLAQLLELIDFVPDRPGHDRRYATDNTKIRRELGWEPTVPFHEGLRQTVRWYIANTEWLARVTSGEYRKYYDSVYARSWNRKVD